MAPAFYNGYPLVFSDTGTYLLSGMDVQLPYDRPVMYGLFVNVSSLHCSLWLTIFFQCLIAAYIFKCTVRLITDTDQKNSFVILLTILVAFTSVGWYASQIMPDIFTSATILSLLILCFPHRLSLAQKIIIGVILILGVNVHSSNLLIAILSLVLIIISSRVYLNETNKKHVRLLLPSSLLILSVITGFVASYAVGKTFTLNQGSHVFMMGRMLDNGVLKEFLDEKCGTQNYVLCDCKDSLPSDSRSLLWAQDSPLLKHGGWIGSKKDYQTVLRDMLFSPKYLMKFAYTTATAGFSQLLQNEVGSGMISTWYSSPDSPPYYQIARHFPHEIKQYEQSRQNENLWLQKLDFTSINLFNSFFIMVSVLFLYAVFFFGKVRLLFNIQTRLMAGMIIAGIVLNAFVTAGLANVYDRLQARVSWMFVFLFLILISSQWEDLMKLLKQSTNQDPQQPNNNR